MVSRLELLLKRVKFHRDLAVLPLLAVTALVLIDPTYNNSYNGQLTIN